MGGRRRSPVFAPRAIHAARLLAVTVAYYGSAKLGLGLTFAHAGVGPISAGAGLALAVVLLGGYRMLPAVALGAFLANLTTALPLGSVLGITAGNTLEALMGAALLSRVGFRGSLRRLYDVVALSALAGLVSAAVGATAGVASLVAGGVLAHSAIGLTWREWWLSDMGGVLLCTPPLLVLAATWPPRWPGRRRLEGLAAGGVLVAASVVLLGHHFSLAYLALPTLYWVSLRFRQGGAALGGLVACGIAVWYASRGQGPFLIAAGAGVDLLRVQTFVALATITALMVAAMRSEHDVAETALARLGESERALAEAQQLTRIGSFKWDLDGDRAGWSDEFYRMLGLRREDCPASYAAWRDRIHPDDRDMVETTLARAREERERCRFVHHVRRPDGHMRTVECYARIEADSEGEPIRMVVSCQDVTAFKLAREGFRSLLETAPDAMVIVDERGDIVLVNSQTERLFGYGRDELIGASVELLLPERFGPGQPDHAKNFGSDPEAPTMGGLELYARRKDGREFPVEISLSPLETEDGTLVSSAIRDITERKLAQDALAHQATHDSLTGLPNRGLFLDRLEDAIVRARRAHSTLGVLFLDVDDFKLVNDTLGHEAGDRVLVEITPRLRAALRPGDTVARFGGDEFVVLCEDLCSHEDATRIAERIAFACSRPVTVGPHEHRVTISAGVAVVASGASTATDLLRDADAAMYRAKAAGKGRVEMFDLSLRDRLMAPIGIESDLRHALERGELRLHYQPVISLDGGEIVGVEALLRWQHPERGLLEPAQFMKVAERTGLIVPIGAWAIDEACRQAALWRDARGLDQPPLTVSVNVSPRQIADSEFATSVVEILDRTGLDPSLLDLEITESVLLDHADVSARVLGELKAIGVRLVLDDFGTGYASLSHLRRFTIDALKIDRSFVDGLDRDPENGAIVNAVLSMARALDVGVTAEGVETPDQLARLRACGCPFAQGFLFSEPIPPDDVPEMVEAALAGIVAG